MATSCPLGLRPHFGHVRGHTVPHRRPGRAIVSNTGLRHVGCIHTPYHGVPNEPVPWPCCTTPRCTGITNKEFTELAQRGQNYLTYTSNVQIILRAKKLRQTIRMGTSQDLAPTPNENDRAMHFLRHHLCITLKNEHMAMKSPLTLWTMLKK
ncbi:hypothetical protein E2562_028794 [Oryza meyeriana var. granulata]|uniref:Uncharacterized protein n=1 Tax=Oryza meyeriana var. granulata TaxID=110450 RepID=A0A6G1EC11_9ORYZ|nr:hypothetical protein E2562_028794 [Oryza meyeriana var. granulata]